MMKFLRRLFQPKHVYRAITILPAKPHLAGSDQPRLDKFFDDGRCPDCGAKEWEEWQDGGHDYSIHCRHCKSNFGIQAPPFYLIERCGKPWYHA